MVVVLVVLVVMVRRVTNASSLARRLGRPWLCDVDDGTCSDCRRRCCTDCRMALSKGPDDASIVCRPNSEWFVSSHVPVAVVVGSNTRDLLSSFACHFAHDSRFLFLLLGGRT